MSENPSAGRAKPQDRQQERADRDDADDELVHPARRCLTLPLLLPLLLFLAPVAARLKSHALQEYRPKLTSR